MAHNTGIAPDESTQPGGQPGEPDIPRAGHNPGVRLHETVRKGRTW